MNDWYEAEQRIERAHQLAESRQWDEALAQLDAALAINPAIGAWQAHRGYLLDQLERYEDAAAAYRSAIKLDPGGVDVHIALGVDLARMERFTEAVEVLDTAQHMAPDQEVVYCYRILAYSELGQHDLAEEMFYLAQQIKEDCPHCFFHMGGSLAARGEYERAIYCWGRTLDIDPEYPGVRQCIGHAYRDQDNLDRAREYYLAEVRLDPGNVDLLFDMAELELAARNPAKAAAKLRQIVELDPEYAQAQFALGEVLLEMDEPHEALEALRMATELDPDISHLHLRLGHALLQLGEYRDAEQHLAAAHGEAPRDSVTLTAWGNCLLRLGRPAEAANKFRRVLAMDESSADAHHNLGVCHFLAGDYETGLRHLIRAIEASPRDLIAMHKAVLVLMHVGRWSEARAMIERALTLDPQDSALRELRDRFWRYRLRALLVRVVRVVRGLLARLRK